MTINPITPFEEWGNEYSNVGISGQIGLQN